MVHLVSGRDIKFDLMPVKRAFYSSCNSIFMNSNSLNELAWIPGGIQALSERPTGFLQFDTVGLVIWPV